MLKWGETDKSILSRGSVGAVFFTTPICSSPAFPVRQPCQSRKAQSSSWPPVTGHKLSPTTLLNPFWSRVNRDWKAAVIFQTLHSQQETKSGSLPRSTSIHNLGLCYVSTLQNSKAQFFPQQKVCTSILQITISTYFFLFRQQQTAKKKKKNAAAHSLPVLVAMFISLCHLHIF